MSNPKYEDSSLINMDLGKMLEKMQELAGWTESWENISAHMQLMLERAQRFDKEACVAAFFIAYKDCAADFGYEILASDIASHFNTSPETIVLVERQFLKDIDWNITFLAKTEYGEGVEEVPEYKSGTQGNLIDKLVTMPIEDHMATAATKSEKLFEEKSQDFQACVYDTDFFAIAQAVQDLKRETKDYLAYVEVKAKKEKNSAPQRVLKFGEEKPKGPWEKKEDALKELITALESDAKQGDIKRNYKCKIQGFKNMMASHKNTLEHNPTSRCSQYLARVGVILANVLTLGLFSLVSSPYQMLTWAFSGKTFTEKVDNIEKNTPKPGSR